MTTQIDSSSPFTGAAGNNQPTAVAEEFSIRTMKDDLLALQKKPAGFQSVPEARPIEKISVVAAPEPPKKPAAAEEKVPLTAAPEPPKQPPVPEEKTFRPAPVAEKVPARQPAEFGKEFIPMRPQPDKEPVSADTDASGGGVYKLALSAVVILIVAAIGLGGYYFWTARAPQPTQPAAVNQPAPQPAPEPTPQPQPIAVPVEKYSADKPNYLSLAPAALSPEGLKKALIDTADELGSKAVQKPYEFVAVDQDNKRLTFSAFAEAAKLTLSPAVSAGLGNDFSLYLYDDNGATRLSVAIDIVKQGAAPAALAKQEKTFVTDAAFLFLDAQPQLAAGAFKSGTYGDVAIRYVNLSSQAPAYSLSIDYAIVDGRLVIATSKNATSAVLDKLTIDAASRAQASQTAGDAATAADPNAAGAAN